MPRMRRTAASACRSYRALLSWPIFGPDRAALSSSCTVPSGVRLQDQVFVFDAPPPAFFTWCRCLAQELSCARIEQAHMQSVPLNSAPSSADPARRHAVVGGFDLDTAVKVNGSLAMWLVVAKVGSTGSGWRKRFLFARTWPRPVAWWCREYACPPSPLPSDRECALRSFQAVEALTFKRRLLGMADARLYFAFPVGIADPAGHGDSAIVSEHIPIERIQSGIVNIGSEDTFFKVVGDHHSCCAAQPPEGLLMQFGPDAGTGLEAEKPNALAAEAQRQHEQTCTAVLARLRIADHGAGAVIDLRLFIMGCVP